MSTTTVYSGPTAEDLARIPAALKDRDQWVLWRGADKVDKSTGEVKLTKIPIDPQTLRHADTTDPTTWGTFAHCVAALPVALEGGETEDPHDYRGGGLDFVFTDDDPFVGVDLDRCVDLLTHEVAPWAQAHVDTLTSYTERTPSGTGLHMLVQGTLPPKGRKKGHLEMYSWGRFFTMTGWHLAGTPPTIEPRQEALTTLHAAVFGPQDSPRQHTPHVTVTLEDTALLTKARAAKNREKFRRLFAGETDGHAGDDSAADMALCCLLAFWTQDASQIDRLFRQSGLMRPKWDAKRGATTYGDRTVAEALAWQTEHYRPKGDASQRQNGRKPVDTAGEHDAPPADVDLAAFLARLAATPEADRFQVALDAMPDLAGLPLATWLHAKRALKAQIPTINLNDLERLRTALCQEAHARAQAETAAANPAWQNALFTTKAGDVLETENNLQAIFAHHAQWVDRLWWDVVGQRAYLDTDQALDIHYVRNDVVPWLGSVMRMPVYHGQRVLDVMRSWAQREPAVHADLTNRTVAITPAQCVVAIVLRLYLVAPLGP